MALQIKDIYLSQMQRLVVIFSAPPEGEPVLRIDGEAVPLLKEDVKRGTDNSGENVIIARCRKMLDIKKTYNVSIEIGEEVVSTDYYATVEPNNALRLQQAVFDILSFNQLYDVDDRSLNYLDNGFFAPEDVSDGESLLVSVPFIAVGNAQLVSVTSFCPGLDIIEHEINLKLADEPNADNVNDISHLHNLVMQITHLFEKNSDLNLNQWGVASCNLDYRLSKADDIADGDSLNSVIIRITITQYRSA